MKENEDDGLLGVTEIGARPRPLTPNTEKYVLKQLEVLVLGESKP
jgi:hypothetical protein